MAAKSKYLVFGLGMLALAAGVYFSVLLLLATRTPGPAPPSTEGLAEALQQALGLSEEEAVALAARLQEAVAGAAETEGEASLAQALQQAMGLTEEEAEDLATRLQEALGQASAPSTGGGAQERVGVGDSVEFEVRDAEGNIKQRGSGR